MVCNAILDTKKESAKERTILELFLAVLVKAGLVGGNVKDSLMGVTSGWEGRSMVM